jgi:hypothetical protein
MLDTVPSVQGGGAMHQELLLAIGIQARLTCREFRSKAAQPAQ